MITRSQPYQENSSIWPISPHSAYGNLIWLIFSGAVTTSHRSRQRSAFSSPSFSWTFDFLRSSCLQLNYNQITTLPSEICNLTNLMTLSVWLNRCLIYYSAIQIISSRSHLKLVVSSTWRNSPYAASLVDFRSWAVMIWLNFRWALGNWRNYANWMYVSGDMNWPSVGEK